MSYHTHGALRRYGLGDETTTTTTSFRYHDEAQALARNAFAATPAAQYVLVTFEQNGRNPVVMPFSNTDQAGEMFSSVGDAPGARVYAGVFDKDLEIWNEWFGATISTFETTIATTVHTLKNLAPWIVGGAVLIAGAIYFTRKPGRGRAKRRRSSWRRRTTTVWR